MPKLTDYQIDNLVGDLTSEETARLAARILSRATVSRETTQAFIDALPTDDREEFLAQLDGYEPEE